MNEILQRIMKQVYSEHTWNFTEYRGDASNFIPKTKNKTIIVLDFHRFNVLGFTNPKGFLLDLINPNGTRREVNVFDDVWEKLQTDFDKIYAILVHFIFARLINSNARIRKHFRSGGKLLFKANAVINKSSCLMKLVSTFDIQDTHNVLWVLEISFSQTTEIIDPQLSILNADNSNNEDLQLSLDEQLRNTLAKNSLLLNPLDVIVFQNARIGLSARKIATHINNNYNKRIRQKSLTNIDINNITSNIREQLRILLPNRPDIYASTKSSASFLYRLKFI